MILRQTAVAASQSVATIAAHQQQVAPEHVACSAVHSHRMSAISQQPTRCAVACSAPRSEGQCSFVEYRQYRVIYRRYASLYFIVGIDDGEEANELAILEVCTCRSVLLSGICVVLSKSKT